MAQKLKLDISIADYPHTRRLLTGEVEIEGVEPNFIKVVPQIGAFRRMVRGLEFDVCEVAPTTYIIARAYGVPIIALPIFVMRRFHHGGFLVRPDSGIKHPKDLEGKNAGVRAWSVTTGVWTRGIYATEYGLDISKVNWFVDDEEHVQQMPLPSYVQNVPAGKSLADLMDEGFLQAGFAANAGVGRSGNPTGGWKEVQVDYPELFPNVEEIEADWYAKTGIYPMHGTIVVKDAILKENPWLARSLHEAFEKSKQLWLADLAAGTAKDAKYQALAKVVGDDPLPYGMEANMPTMRALEETAYLQGLTPRRFDMAEIFVDPLK